MYPINGLYINDQVRDYGALDFTPIERANAVKRHTEQNEADRRLEYYKALQPSEHAIFPEDQPILRDKANEYLNKYAEYTAKGLNLANPRTQEERQKRMEVDQMKRDTEAYGAMFQDQKKQFDAELKRRFEQPDQYDIDEFDEKAVNWRKSNPIDRMNTPLVLNPRIDERKVIDDLYGKYSPTDSTERVYQAGQPFLKTTSAYSQDQVQAIANELLQLPEGQKILKRRWNSLPEDKKKAVGSVENLAFSIAQEEAKTKGIKEKFDQITIPAPREKKEDDNITKLITKIGVSRNSGGTENGIQKGVTTNYTPGEITFEGKRMSKPLEVPGTGMIDVVTGQTITDKNLIVGSHPMVVTGIEFHPIVNATDGEKKRVIFSSKEKLVNNGKVEDFKPYVKGRVTVDRGMSKKEIQVLIPYDNVKGNIDAAYGITEDQVNQEKSRIEQDHGVNRKAAISVPIKNGKPDTSKIIKGQVYNLAPGINGIWDGTRMVKAE